MNILVVLLCLLSGTACYAQDMNELQMRERYRQSGSDNDRIALEMMQYQREAVQKGQPQIVIPILPPVPHPPVLVIPQPKLLPKPQ
jgi:hypothetical protein